MNMVPPSKTLLICSLVTVTILGITMASESSYSQAENTTIINATTLPNGTTQLNGTSVPEENMSAVCSMPIFRNSDMCTMQ